MFQLFFTYIVPSLVFSNSLHIINGDSRKPVLDTLKFPYSATGRVSWKGGTLCSAAIIGKRFIVSAAHCFDRGRINVPEDYVFIPGYSNGNAPFGKFRIKEIYSPPFNRQENDIQDFAILVTKKDLPVIKTGFFDIGFLNSKKPLLQIGYGRPSENLQKKQKCSVFGVTSSLTSEADQKLPWLMAGTDCDMLPGDSGGPSLQFDDTKKSYVIVGLSHAYYRNDDLQLQEKHRFQANYWDYTYISLFYGFEKSTDQFILHPLFDKIKRQINEEK